MDDFLIRRVKFSTIAIGIKNHTRNRVEIIGTGFFYDTRGYFLSAGHVLRELKKIEAYYTNNKINFEKIAIHNDVKDDLFLLRSSKIEEILLPEIPKKVVEPTAPVLSDLGIGKITPLKEKNPFLKIKQVPDLTQSYIYTGDEIAMCGFPAGNASLSVIVDKYQGLRFSPVMQFGHVSALLPNDDSIPYGIQTDILTTGGSSGSPIVSRKNGEVVAIAQKIISTPVDVEVPEKAQKKTRFPAKLQGVAQIGIVWGESFNMFNKVPDMTKEDFSKGMGGQSGHVYTQAHVRPEYHTNGVNLSPDDF